VYNSRSVTPHLVESVKNPFINLIIHSFANESNRPQITSNMLSLFNEFFANNWHQKYDINESFYFYLNNKTDMIYHGNLFYLLPQMHHGSFSDDDYGRAFYEQLFQAGLNPSELVKIYQVLEGAPEILTAENIPASTKFVRNTHSLFDFLSNDERRGVFFMNHIHNLLPEETFHQYIKDFSVLHRMVQYKYKDSIEQLLKFNVNVNTLDSNFNTAAFYIRDESLLHVFDESEMNWLYCNPDGKDVLSMFSTLNNEKKPEFVAHAQKKMQEQSIHPDMQIDPEYMKQRIKENLLEMVKSNTVKPILQSFLKQHNITYFSDIKDDKGNTPSMLALDSSEWARYALFIDKDMMKQVNSSGKSLAHLAFNTSNITAHVDKATSIITQIFSSQEHFNLGFNFGLSLMKQLFRHSTDKIILPITWIKKNPDSHLALLGIDSEKIPYWKNIFTNLSISTYQSYQSKEDKVKMIQLFFEFTKDIMIQQDYHRDLEKINADKLGYFIFQKSPTHSDPDRLNYTTSNFHFLAYQHFIQTLENLPDCESMIKKFETAFKQKFLNYVTEGFFNTNATVGYSHDRKLEVFREKFCNMTDDGLAYILKNDQNFILQFPEEYLRHPGHNAYMKKLISYSLLSHDIEEQHDNKDESHIPTLKI
jgi:hypothetical protein